MNDHVLYYQKEASEAEWVKIFHFLTTTTSTLSHDEWNSVSEGMVCMELDQWGDINTMVSAFCSSPHIDCDYQLPSGQTFREVMNGFFTRMTEASGHRFSKI